MFSAFSCPKRNIYHALRNRSKTSHGRSTENQFQNQTHTYIYKNSCWCFCVMCSFTVVVFPERVYFNQLLFLVLVLYLFFFTSEIRLLRLFHLQRCHLLLDLSTSLLPVVCNGLPVLSDGHRSSSLYGVSITMNTVNPIFRTVYPQMSPYIFILNFNAEGTTLKNFN